MKYRTIVADPPWAYPEGWGRIPGGQGEAMAVRRGESVMLKGRKPLPYPSMTLDEIAALPVPELAEANAHLYLWTTNRYLRAAFDILDAWGFRYGQTRVWCKTPMGQGMGGAFANSTEYVLFARRGTCGILRRFSRRGSTGRGWTARTAASRKRSSTW